jgi:hypothetical protein
MASPVLNYGAFTNDELTAWLAAIKTEMMLRTSTGRVKTGSSSAQQYGLDTATWDDLVRTANGISAALGLDFVDTIRVRPNFNPAQRVPDATTFGASPLG